MSFDQFSAPCFVLNFLGQIHDAKHVDSFGLKMFPGGCKFERFKIHGAGCLLGRRLLVETWLGGCCPNRNSDDWEKLLV